MGLKPIRIQRMKNIHRASFHFTRFIKNLIFNLFCSGKQNKFRINRECF